MNLIGKSLFISALTAAVCESPVRAGDYSDPSGFSLTYPADWYAMTDAFRDEALQARLPPELQDWLKKNPMGLTKLALMIMHAGNGGDGANLNVVVEPQQIVVNDASMKKLLGVLAEKYRSMGIQIENEQARIQKIGNRDFIVVDFRSRMLGLKSPLRQKQFICPGDGKTFIITCTVDDNQFAAYSKTFDEIVASFKAPEPAATGFRFKGVLGWGIIGGVIGGMVWVVRKAVAQTRRGDGSSRYDDEPYDDDDDCDAPKRRGRADFYRDHDDRYKDDFSARPKRNRGDSDTDEDERYEDDDDSARKKRARRDSYRPSDDDPPGRQSNRDP